MKTKLTVTIDQDLLQRARGYARGRGLSLSSLIEEALESRVGREKPGSFVERWRGAMEFAERSDERQRRLVDKYGP
jgi:post-segregation antitoxin (ccd killing protein)